MVLGIGTDLIEVDRINKVGSERLASRIFTLKEHLYFKGSPRRRTEMLAGRFAAKEAISKALGCGIGRICAFGDIEIIANDKGRPVVFLSPKVSGYLFPHKRIQIHLSITHSRGLASATAIVEERVEG